MPGVILHVVGENFDPGPFLATSDIKAYSVFRKGDLRFPGNTKRGKVHQDGGFKCVVSSRNGDDFAGEVEDAIAFLKEYASDLLRLASVPAIQSKYLDFGYYLRLHPDGAQAQFDHLPAGLLKLAGDLGLGIELSLYACSDRG